MQQVLIILLALMLLSGHGVPFAAQTDFHPSLKAFYDARVIEIPPPRWTT